MEEFGNIGLRVQNLWKDLKVLEVIEEVRALIVEERSEKDRIHGELEKIYFVGRDLLEAEI